jgi:hypothetical protein
LRGRPQAALSSGWVTDHSVSQIICSGSRLARRC